MGSGWLEKAQAAVFGRREEPPQLYVITCECGMTYSGIRASKPQKTACSRCGAGLFIFPACPYPLPESVARRMRGDEVAPTKTKEPERAPENRRGEKKPKKKSAAVSEEKEPARDPERKTRVTKPSVPISQRLRSVFTPLRLIIVGLAATVGATIAITVRNSQIESARRDVEPAIERGLEAYGKHDFAKAATELSVAVRSLDRLGRSDAKAQQVRQRAREAEAAASLLSSSLAETLAEILNETSSESLAARVERRLAGQWLFLDAPLVATAESGSRTANPRLMVDGAMVIGKLECRIEFSRHPGKGWPTPRPESQPERAIFAAQLETIRVGDGAKSADAVLVLSGATAFLWTSAEGYGGLIPPPPMPRSANAGKPCSMRSARRSIHRRKPNDAVRTSIRPDRSAGRVVARHVFRLRASLVRQESAGEQSRLGQTRGHAYRGGRPAGIGAEESIAPAKV